MMSRMRSVNELEKRYLEVFKKSANSDKLKEKIEKMTKTDNFPREIKIRLFAGTISNEFVYEEASGYEGYLISETDMGDMIFTMGDTTLPIKEEEADWFLKSFIEINTEKDKIETDVGFHNKVDMGCSLKDCKSKEEIIQRMRDNLVSEKARLVSDKLRYDVEELEKQKEREEKIKNDQMGLYDSTYFSITNKRLVAFKKTAVKEQIRFHAPLKLADDALHYDEKQINIGRSSWDASGMDWWLDFALKQKLGCDIITAREDDVLKLKFDGEKIMLNDVRIRKDKAMNIIKACIRETKDVEKYKNILNKLGTKKLMLCDDMQEIQLNGIGKNEESLNISISITAIDEEKATLNIFGKDIEVQWSFLLREFLSGRHIHSYLYDMEEFFTKLGMGKEEYLEKIKESLILQKL